MPFKHLSSLFAICPKCKQDNVVKAGFQTYGHGVKRQRFKCQKCGHVWTEKEKEVS